MAANPTDLAVRTYNKGRSKRLPIGATTVLPGQLCKFSSNLIVPLATTDAALDCWVCLETGVAADVTIGGLFVPFADAVVAMTYSGGTPTVGTAYGVSGPATVDVTNTTQKMVIVVSVNTTDTTVDVVRYDLSS